MLDLSQASKLALPKFLASLLLLAVNPAFANANANGVTVGSVDRQDVNNPRLTAKLKTEANARAIGQHNPGISLQAIDGQLLFESQNAPLPHILKQIAGKTGAQIQCSALPQESVTAICVGLKVKSIMGCLLGNQIYRQTAHTKTKQPESLYTQTSVHPVETWLMGGRFGNTPNTMECVVEGKPSAQAKPEKPDSQQNPHQALLRMAQVNSDPRWTELKKQVISLLVTQGKTGDPSVDDEVIATLQQALVEPDAEYRAQAVSAC